MAGSAREWILSGTQYGTVKFCCSVGYSTSLKVSRRDDIQYLIGTRLELSIGVGGGKVQFSCSFLFSMVDCRPGVRVKPSEVYPSRLHS